MAQFDRQIRSEGTHTDSSFVNASIRQRDVNEAGQPTHVQEHAIARLRGARPAPRGVGGALRGIGGAQADAPMAQVAVPCLAACCARDDEPRGAHASSAPRGGSHPPEANRLERIHCASATGRDVLSSIGAERSCVPRGVDRRQRPERLATTDRGSCSRLPERSRRFSAG